MRPRRDRRSSRNRSPAVAGEGLWSGPVDRPAQPEVPSLLLFVPAAIRRPCARRTQQMLVLGLLFQVTGVPTNLAVALAGGSLAALVARRPFWAAVQRWCSSAVLIGLGLRLALSDRR